GSACFQQTGEQALSDYNRQKEAAENILRNGGELDRANSHYRSALKIAQDMRWADGIAIAERGRADVAAANRDFPLAEKILLETKEFCISNEECSSGQLAAI